MPTTARMTVRKHQVFMSGEGGRIVFRCDCCDHYPEEETCNHPEIIKLAKQGEYGLSLHPNGLAKVMPDDCSDYYEPMKR